MTGRAKWKHTEKLIDKLAAETFKDWCLALHGVHDEHQCRRKPGHEKEIGTAKYTPGHECYCGVLW